jgi:hypothetical protein
MSTDRKQLRKDKPETWIAVEPGDELIGIITDVDSAWSDYKKRFYPLLEITVGTATGYAAGDVLRVHGLATTLESAILKFEPMPGETVKIVYVGTSTKSKPGQSPAEIYRLNVHGRDPVVNAKKVYGTMRDAPEPVPEPEVDVPIGNGDLGEPATADQDPSPF